MTQALEKADEAKNTAVKSVTIISTTTNAIDNILGQIGKCCHEFSDRCKRQQIFGAVPLWVTLPYLNCPLVDWDRH